RVKRPPRSRPTCAPASSPAGCPFPRPTTATLLTPVVQDEVPRHAAAPPRGVGDVLPSLGGLRQADPDFLKEVFRRREIANHPVDEGHQGVSLRQETRRKRLDPAAHVNPDVIPFHEDAKGNAPREVKYRTSGSVP